MSVGFFALTGVLFLVSIVSFFWASGSSRRGGGKRTPNVPNVQVSKRVVIQKGGLAEEADQTRARAPAPVSAGPGGFGAGAGEAAASPNALAWATFAVSAFGTLSSFVFSLLTFLKAS